jgi:hypothetical protein
MSPQNSSHPELYVELEAQSRPVFAKFEELRGFL